MTSSVSTLVCRTDTEDATNLTSLPLCLCLSLSQLTEIMQLMNAYFGAIRRQRGKDADVTVTESTEVGFHHLGSTHKHNLLPSHPV